MIFGHTWNFSQEKKNETYIMVGGQELIFDIKKSEQLINLRTLDDDDVEGIGQNLTIEDKIKANVFANNPSWLDKKIIAAALARKINEWELTKLKELVINLKKIYTQGFTSNKATKDAISLFAKAQSGEEKKIWDIVNANSVKINDTDAKTWATIGWEKVKDFQKNDNNLENKPNKTAEEKAELDQKRKQLEQLDKNSEPSNSKEPTNWTPWIVGGLALVGVLIISLTVWKFKKKKVKL